MDEPDQTQGSPSGSRRSAESASAIESQPTQATPPPLPDTHIMVPPSRRPERRRPGSRAAARRGPGAHRAGARVAPASRRPAREEIAGEPSPSRGPVAGGTGGSTRARRRAGWDDPRILLAMLATVLALPALLLISRPGSTNAEALSTESDASVVARSRVLVASTTEAPTSTAAAATTSEPATTPAPPTTEAAPPTTEWTPPTTAWTPPTTAWTPPTTVWTPPATTPPTTAWVPPPTTAAPVAAGNSESGEASWYDWRPGECAHKTIPKGTRVMIRASNGNTASCVVTDRGPFGPGRIIDLDRGTFAQLTSPGTGVIGVTITW